MLDRPSNYYYYYYYYFFFFFLIFFQTRLGHITSAKVCKDKALLICIIIISVFNFKSFDQFNPPPRTTSNFRHLLSCGTIEFSLFAVSTGFVGRDE